MRKTILLISVVFAINVIVSCKQLGCKYNSCGCDPLPSNEPVKFSFNGLEATLNKSDIFVRLIGEEVAFLGGEDLNEDIVFSLNGMNRTMACSIVPPEHFYQDTLQEFKVFTKINEILTDITTDVQIANYLDDTVQYSVNEYLELPSKNTEEEQWFHIVSQKENLISSGKNYRIVVKFSNGEEYVDDL